MPLRAISLRTAGSGSFVTLETVGTYGGFGPFETLKAFGVSEALGGFGVSMAAMNLSARRWPSTIWSDAILRISGSRYSAPHVVNFLAANEYHL